MQTDSAQSDDAPSEHDLAVKHQVAVLHYVEKERDKLADKKKQLDDLEVAANTELFALIGEDFKGDFLYQGKPLFSRTRTDGRNTFQQKDFRADYPDLAAKYTKRTPGWKFQLADQEESSK